MIREMTVYELAKAFRQSLALFYSASLGSIQLAVKKLAAGGYVSCREVLDGGRRKKVYRIRAAGRKAFAEGMVAPVPPSRLEVTALSRLSFLGLLDRAERRKVLALLTAAIGEALQGLEGLKTELDRTEAPGPWKDLFHYQVLTLEYGIMAHRAALEWFSTVPSASRPGE